MESYQKKYYDLYQFLGGYFHQDWSHCYEWNDQGPDWKVPVLQFKKDALPDELAIAIKELESLLAEQLTEPELEDALDELGSFVYVPALGYKAYRAWAEDILKILKES